MHPRLATSIIVGGILTVGVVANAMWNPTPVAQEDAMPLPAQEVRLGRLLAAAPDVKVDDLPTDVYQKVIRADEIINKWFSSQSGAFELYVARWKPHSPYSFHATAHPPDWCLGLTGWQCVDSRGASALDRSVSIAQSAEWRRFTAPDGQPHEVAFWCVKGSALVRLEPRPFLPGLTRRDRGLIAGSDFLRHWWARANGRPTEEETRRAAAAARPPPPSSNEEVVFVRVSSRLPLEELIAQPLFGVVAPLFRELGLGPEAAERPVGR